MLILFLTPLLTLTTHIYSNSECLACIDSQNLACGYLQNQTAPDAMDCCPSAPCDPEFSCSQDSDRLDKYGMCFKSNNYDTSFCWGLAYASGSKGVQGPLNCSFAYYLIANYYEKFDVSKISLKGEIIEKGFWDS